MYKWVTALAIVMTCVAGGDVWVVDDDGGVGVDFTEIQDAVFAADDGDRILVHPGTYNWVNFYNRELIVTGTDPNDPNTVDATVISAISGYAVIFEGQDPNTLLEGFRIEGAGIRCYQSSPTISKNIITDCWGKGIEGIQGAAPRITANAIANCGGEAIWNCDGAIEYNAIAYNDANALSGCDGDIYGNEISYNRGAGLVDCTGMVSNNTITQNREGLVGCTGTIIANMIAENEQAGARDCGEMSFNDVINNGDGGLVSCAGTIIFNRISGNRGKGGLYQCSGTIVNNQICGNRGVDGAGLYMCTGSILNCTLVGNLAANKGGALYECNAIVANNIIAFNDAPMGGAIYDLASVHGSCANSYNCFYANTTYTLDGDVTWGEGDILRDPRFAANGYWDWGLPGDPNDDYWHDGDYHLKSQAGRWDPDTDSWVFDSVNSMCIDAGDPAMEPLEETYPNGDRINMGVWGGTSEASRSIFGQAVICTDAIDGNLNDDPCGPSWCRLDYYDYLAFSQHWTEQAEELSIGFAEQWVERFNGEGANEDSPVGMVMDSLDNVTVSGTSVGTATGRDYLTVQYDPNGVVRWQQRYDGEGLDDYATDIAVDALNRVTVTGWERTAATNKDFCTIRYDSEGTELWVARYAGSGIDLAQAVAVDAAGNSFVTGSTEVSANQYDYRTVKYDPNGNEVWNKTYNGPDNLNDFAADIAIDKNGHVYVTGRSTSNANAEDYLTIQYDANSGQPLWTKRLDSSANNSDVPKVLTVDSAGNVYVSGISLNSSGDYDIMTVAYDRDGNQMWSGPAIYDGAGGNSDYAEDMLTDTLGHLYVVGSSQEGTSGNDFVTIQYDVGTGAENWVRLYSGTATRDDSAAACALDELEQIHVAGKSMNSSGTYECAAVKYDIDGNELFDVRYNGGYGNDTAGAIVIRDLETFYLSGAGRNPVSHNDYLTIRYSEEFACSASLIGDFDEDCQVGLSDLAVLIKNWLECYRHPEEACLF